VSEKLVAKIERYIFRNDESAYTIAKVLSEDGDEEIIVGYIPMLMEDTYYEFFGEWINHDKYGHQFKIESFKKSELQSIDGLISYLSSSLFFGIGPVTATKIVDLLGIDAVKKIIEDPNVLNPLKFSSEKKARLKAELLDNEYNEYTLVKLYGFNIGGKTAMKIIDTYGLLAVEKLEENPYDLITDISGIGFIKADEIAERMGILKDDPRRIKAAILYAFEVFSNSRGDIYLNKELLFKQTLAILKVEVDLESFLNELIEKEQIILEEDRYYLKYNYTIEVELAKEIKRINQGSSEITSDYVEAILSVIEIQNAIEYTNLQKQAIINALTNKVAIITGGPGTGKTTIIAAVLEIYSQFYNLNLVNENTYYQIALMAPTGRAAKRMEEVLDYPAKTIHRHLGFGYDGKFSYSKDNPLPFNLIIIDEASMIDVFLAHKLFSSIKDNTKIVIVGDQDQLPSVSPGQVLKDLIDSKTINTSKLKEIHRQAINSNIIKLAHQVNIQQLDYYNLNSGGDLFLANINFGDVAKTIVSQVKGALSQGYDLIEDIQVLIPMYRGDVGIDNLNLLMQNEFNKEKVNPLKYGDKEYYENDKVIQLANDPERGVMNGDIGKVIKIGKDHNNKDFMQIDFDGQIAVYDKEALKDISLAYAMSIHKSQGSEYKIVIMPLVKQHTHMLKKELLYTAITRAKQFLIIVGDMSLLVYAANNLAEARKTTLKKRLITN